MGKIGLVSALLALCGGAAQAAPMPREILGAWTDEAGCGRGMHSMIFAATTVTVVQSDGRRKSLQVDTTGAANDRLEIKVVKVLAGEAEDSIGAHVGDVIVARVENGQVHFIGHGTNGVITNDPSGPLLHRCK